MRDAAGTSSAGIQVHLAQAARWLAAEHHGKDAAFRGVSIDSRTLQAGALFIALRGPNFDAHDFAQVAMERGAAALLLERRLDLPLPQLIVHDTRLALGRLAAAWRQQCKTPLAAITGSSGKTTVKEMCRSILAQTGSTLATEGNLNNDIGVPLSLLRLTPQHRFAVIEMGANHPGEIAYLSDLARPDAAVITNAGAAHLAGFGSEQGVAEAKGEIYEGLRDNGIAVINIDAPWAELWRERALVHRQLHFGLTPEASVTARWQAEGQGSRLQLETPIGATEFSLGLPGEHNVMNALAATALALALGADLAAVCRGLESVHGLAGRLQLDTAAGGARLIDDSYNANPLSMCAAIDVLASYPAPRILALGDMGELGVQARQLHREIGAYARAQGIETLFAVGEFSHDTVAGFGSGAEHFSDKSSLGSALLARLDAAATVLVKGSRSAGMEQLVALLKAGGAA